MTRSDPTHAPAGTPLEGVQVWPLSTEYLTAASAGLQTVLVPSTDKATTPRLPADVPGDQVAPPSEENPMLLPPEPTRTMRCGASSAKSRLVVVPVTGLSYILLGTTSRSS